MWNWTCEALVMRFGCGTVVWLTSVARVLTLARDCDTESKHKQLIQQIYLDQQSFVYLMALKRNKGPGYRAENRANYPLFSERARRSQNLQNFCEIRYEESPV